jgi:hypothetical protein
MLHINICSFNIAIRTFCAWVASASDFLVYSVQSYNVLQPAGDKLDSTMPDGIQNWASGEPKNEPCLAVGYSGIGKWDDVTCNESMNAWLFCRKTVGYKLASNRVHYKLLYQTPKSHQEARALCKKDGAMLANAPYGQPDKDAFEQFAALLTGLFGRGVLDGILVDGTDKEVEGMWKLPNGANLVLDQRRK